jgi:predicted RNA binding protein YcfA (HicA-like mRNA interferase family)
MSAIDFSRLRSLTARRLVAAPERDGFVLSRQSGSHRHYRHADGRRVTLTFHHASDTFRFKTLRSMIEVQAQWQWEDLVRLQLV